MNRISFRPLSKKNVKRIQIIYIKFRYLNDDLSIKNLNFLERLLLMYPSKIEIQETTDKVTSTSLSDLFLAFVTLFQLKTRIYAKRADFNFESNNSPYLSTNIITLPANGIFIIKLFWYSRAYSCYSDFIKRYHCLIRNLMKQGYFKRLVLLFKYVH